MIKKKLYDSPMWYFISENRHEQAILFVHAAFADHSQYDKQIDSFSEKFTVITVDLIGHGSSIETQKGDGIEKTAKYIKNVLLEENVQSAHLVGISIGAILVQDFANQYPNMVSSLICFGGYDKTQIL